MKPANFAPSAALALPVAVMVPVTLSNTALLEPATAAAVSLTLAIATVVLAPLAPTIAVASATLAVSVTDTLTAALAALVFAAKLAAGTITRIRVIGQGTAAVAGTSLIPVLTSLVDSSIHVEALTATELSGFAMEQDMSDMLVIAVSQSGTTTDTNRTVDLVATRGASVLAIVNRRGSDLASKAHGVYYTSDGRDVEMSVASTKAFYAQVAAGAVLSCAIAQAVGRVDGDRMHRILASLVDMPAAMQRVIAQREEIGVVARQYAPSRRYWAVVGNGPNTVAAHEVRIKLSELCYKSISCDVTEDKKHIDLSCEPMILV